MEDVIKSVALVKSVDLDPDDLALINAQAKAELTAEQVYTFAIRLCDNEIDRDLERFPRASLEKLADLFVGKSGIFDHLWTAKGQAARLYKTEVVDEPDRTTAAGDPYSWLKGYAYTVRTESNQDLIAEIDAGIKREVSVGCSVGRMVCSICGSSSGSCGHQKGQVYDGQLCYFSLEDPVDAYEWSFVAVPAQPGAGVVKNKRYGVGQTPAIKMQPQPGAAPGTDNQDWQDEALLELEKNRF